MKFIDNMYVSDGIKNKESVIYKLKKGIGVDKIYCICVDKNSNSVVEIIYSYEIHKQLYSNKDYILIGIADSKNAAKQILLQIVEKIYSEDTQLKHIKETLLSLSAKEE